jgi:hypothetical protein
MSTTSDSGGGDPPPDPTDPGIRPGRPPRRRKERPTPPEFTPPDVPEPDIPEPDGGGCGEGPIAIGGGLLGLIALIILLLFLIHSCGGNGSSTTTRTSQLSTAAITYKDGCALLSTGDAGGYMTTSSAKAATSAPAGVPGTPWHPAQLRSPGWVYPCTWSASKPAVDSTRICFWGSGAAPPQYTLILQNHIEPSSDTAVSYITSNKDYQVEEISSLKGKTYADLTVERAFFLWRAPQPPDPQTCNAGMGSQGAVFVSLTGPLLHDTRAIFEFDLATQDVLALTSRSDVESVLLRMAAQVLPRVR